MHAPAPLVYRCPICGAEVTVLGEPKGHFSPRCCGKDMALLARRVRIYFCPQCGAQVMLVTPGQGDFQPRCCGLDMLIKAA
jgi:DNA-directed RNA polymerase subunit RPC12/RpoP